MPQRKYTNFPALLGFYVWHSMRFKRRACWALALHQAIGQLDNKREIGKVILRILIGAPLMTNLRRDELLKKHKATVIKTTVSYETTLRSGQ